MKIQIALVLAVAAGVSTPGLAETHVIEAHNMSFMPAEVNAAPGDTIRWEYVTGYPHSVTSGTSCTHDGLYFNHYPLDVFEWVVPDDAPAQVPFFCDPHCDNGMEGVINVYSGHMVIGLIDSAWLYETSFSYNDKTGTAYLFMSAATGGTFAIGVEIEGGDALVGVNAQTGTITLYDVTANTQIPLSGNQDRVLLDGHKYVFNGNNNPTMSLSWPDTPGDPPSLNQLWCGNCSIHKSGDVFSIRTDSGQLSFSGPGDLTMTPIGIGVDSPNMTMPANGEEGVVAVPATGGTVLMNGVSNPAWLLIGGNDGGGDEGCAEDVNDDGVVNVNDLLAIIAAWGNTCP